MRISDWSSDVCSSDLEIVESAQNLIGGGGVVPYMQEQQVDIVSPKPLEAILNSAHHILAAIASGIGVARLDSEGIFGRKHKLIALFPRKLACKLLGSALGIIAGCIHRSEEHTSELQSLMRTSYAVFRCKKHRTRSDNNKNEDEEAIYRTD